MQAFLKTKFQISTVPFTWIEGCVAWSRNLHSASTHFQELFEFVAQQWLLADFRQLKIKSLPINLKGSPVINLDENYLLQVFPASLFGLCSVLFLFSSFSFSHILFCFSVHRLVTSSISVFQLTLNMQR